MPLKAKQTTQSSCVFRKNTNCSVGALLLRSPRCKRQDVEPSVTRKQLTDALERTGAALESWSPSAPLYPSVGQQHWGQEGQHESQIPVWFVNCRDIDLQGCSEEWNPLAASMMMGRVQRECNLTADCSGEEGQSPLLLWLKPFLYVSCAAPQPAGPWVITNESIYCANFNNGGQNCMVMAYGYSWFDKQPYKLSVYTNMTDNISSLCWNLYRACNTGEFRQQWGIHETEVHSDWG